MQFGGYLWEKEAYGGERQLVVVQRGAKVIPVRGGPTQISLVAEQPAEPHEAFVGRVLAKLPRPAGTLRSAHLCLNSERGWRCSLRRYDLARHIAAAMADRDASLYFVYPEHGERFTTEFLTLADLLRREFPTLTLCSRTRGAASRGRAVHAVAHRNDRASAVLRSGVRLVCAPSTVTPPAKVPPSSLTGGDPDLAA